MVRAIQRRASLATSAPGAADGATNRSISSKSCSLIWKLYVFPVGGGPVELAPADLLVALLAQRVGAAAEGDAADLGHTLVLLIVAVMCGVLFRRVTGSR